MIILLRIIYFILTLLPVRNPFTIIEGSDKTILNLRKDQIFGLKDHIVIAVFEDGGVALNLEDRVSHELNWTGARIIQLLDGRRDLDTLIRTFASLCGKPEDHLEKDMSDFLTSLMERGWVYVKQ